jgi:transposase
VEALGVGVAGAAGGVLRNGSLYIILQAMSNDNPLHYHEDGARAAGPAFDQVRQAAHTLMAEGRGDEAFDFLLSALAAVLKKSRELELLLAKLRRVGRSSERVDPGQLALLFEELVSQLGPEAGTSDLEAEAREDAALEYEIEQARDERPGASKPERSTWRTEGVKREVHTVAVPPEERTCERCGQPKHKIGEDVSPVLEYVPARFVEHEYRLEKWACRSCKRGVTTAPGPAKVIDRSAAGASAAHRRPARGPAAALPHRRPAAVSPTAGSTTAWTSCCPTSGTPGPLPDPRPPQSLRSSRSYELGWGKDPRPRILNS